jgi:hypothetical protein
MGDPVPNSVTVKLIAAPFAELRKLRKGPDPIRNSIRNSLAAHFAGCIGSLCFDFVA